MRLVTPFLAALAVSVALAQSSTLGLIVRPAAPTILFTRGAGVHVRQTLTVQLARGENRLLVDTAALQTDPAGVTLRVLEPAESRGAGVSPARVLGATPGQPPGRMVWTLAAEAPTAATLRLGYEITYLKADVAYRLLLNPAANTLAVEATLTIVNNGKSDLPPSRMVFPQGHETTTALPAGQTVQQQLFALRTLPYEIRYLYDVNRFKDTVHAMLLLPADAARRTALPAGRARLFAAAAGAPPTFVADASLPYVASGEQFELDLGAAPEIAILRSRLRSEQVNVRTDIYHKLALFDLEEDYELEISNHRPGPIALLVREHPAGDWQLTKSSMPGRQTDSATVEFALRLPAGAKEKLTFSTKRLNAEP
jgi:hypothetical protein